MRKRQDEEVEKLQKNVFINFNVVNNTIGA